MELADILHPRLDPWKIMVLLRAYLDESGTHAGSRIVAIGGFVGSAGTWQKLEGEWAAALAVFDGADLEAFHATDCENGNREFEHIPIELRIALAQKLAKAISGLGLFGVWCAVIADDWNATDFDAQFSKEFPHPFYLCFATVAQKLARWTALRTDEARMAVVYAEHQEFGANAERLWDAYSRNKRVAHLSSFSTASPRDCLPLQAADFLAYEMNRDWEAREYEIGTPSAHYHMPEPLKIIQQGGGLDISGCYDAEALQAAMRRFRTTGEI